MYTQRLYDPNRFQDAGPYYFDENKHTSRKKYKKMKDEEESTAWITEIWNNEIVLYEKEWYNKVNSIRKNKNFTPNNKNSIGYVVHSFAFDQKKYTLDLPVLLVNKGDENKILYNIFTLKHLILPYQQSVKDYFNNIFLEVGKDSESEKIKRVFPNYTPMPSDELKWAWAARRYKMEYSVFNNENNDYKDCFILRCQRNVSGHWFDMCSILSTLTDKKSKKKAFQWHLKNIYDTFFKGNPHLTLFKPEKKNKNS